MVVGVFNYSLEESSDLKGFYSNNVMNSREKSTAVRKSEKKQEFIGTYEDTWIEKSKIKMSLEIGKIENSDLLNLYWKNEKTTEFYGRGYIDENQQLVGFYADHDLKKIENTKLPPLLA